MFQVFLPLIGVQHIRAIRFTATNVIKIQRVFVQGVRSITWRKKDVDPQDKERTKTN